LDINSRRWTMIPARRGRIAKLIAILWTALDTI
jgi:hypothetical protein